LRALWRLAGYLCEFPEEHPIARFRWQRELDAHDPGDVDRLIDDVYFIRDETMRLRAANG
jgi:hypothetical protein